MNYERSQETDKLDAALAKAQSDINAVTKGSDNPYFDSKYADLAACWDSVHQTLAKNGISVFQGASHENGIWALVTELGHAGQYKRAYVPLLFNGKNPMQALGAAMTYARRYGLCAAVGLAQKDDDANSAHDGQKNGGMKTAKPALPPGMKQAGEALADPFNMEQ